MGCCASNGSSAPLNSGNTNSNANNRQSKAGGGKKEDKIELAFKVKRANIFTEGVDLGRQAYVEKKISKTAKQSKLICKILQMFNHSKNYHFFISKYIVAKLYICFIK